MNCLFLGLSNLVLAYSIIFREGVTSLGTSLFNRQQNTGFKSFFSKILNTTSTRDRIIVEDTLTTSVRIKLTQ